MRKHILCVPVIVVVLAAVCEFSLAQTPLGPAFTYQGQLKEGGLPASGTYNMQFKLYDAGGSLLATYPPSGTVAVDVANGLFTQAVDFGATVFTGEERWLEVVVDGVPLTPRQELTAVPYALYALSGPGGGGNADTVDYFHASATPTANMLLPLNASTKFPNSVLMTGAGNALDADLLDGLHGAFYRDASNLNAGTLPDARLAGTYSSALTFSNATNSFAGSGSGLTNLNANNLATGTVADARLSSNVALLNNAQTFTGAKTFSTGPSFTAAGAPFSVTSSTVVTNLNADWLDGQTGSFYQNASNINAGTLADGRLSSNVALLDNTQTFTGGKTFSAAPGFTAAGAPFTVSSATKVTNLNADWLDGYNSGNASGQIPVSNGTVCTNLNADLLDGQTGSFYQNAGNINAGTLADARLSSNVALLNNAQTFTGAKTFSASNSFTGLQNTFAGNVGIGTSTPPENVKLNVVQSTNGWGVRVESAGGIGVSGADTAGSGTTVGVWGQSVSTSGTGVRGSALATSGFNYGGVFDSNSPQGTGVMGLNSATSGGMGVAGGSNGTSGIGVCGVANAFSGTNYGVWGESYSPAGWGVWAQGRSGASGLKLFRIDHPHDPENRYLLHYSHEGPEPQNVYNGNVVTDGKGYATITLPEYFEEINKDPRYTLTVIDDSDDFVLAKVVREIRNNEFVIRTNKPFVKVSWRVDAVRNDLWVRQYGAPVEVEKSETERGKYQHPELYGQPPEMGMNYDAEHERSSPVTLPGETRMERRP